MSTDPETNPHDAYVVRCSEKENPLSGPLPYTQAEQLADYHNDNQGEDYCIGDHWTEPWDGTEAID